MTQITILLRTTTYYLLIAICFRESKSEIQNYAGPEAIKSIRSSNLEVPYQNLITICIYFCSL